MLPAYAISYCHINLVVVTLTVLVLGTIYIPFVVRELRVGYRKNYKCSVTLRYPENLQKVYRMVQILQILANQILGPFLIPFQVISTLLFVFSGYTVITYRDQLAEEAVVVVIMWVIVGPVGWGSVLSMGGYLHSNGLKILNSWKHSRWMSSQEKKVMARFARSCTPVTISYGKVYVVQSTSLMVFVRGLSRGLVRALLTLQ